MFLLKDAADSKGNSAQDTDSKSQEWRLVMATGQQLGDWRGFTGELNSLFNEGWWDDQPRHRLTEGVPPDPDPVSVYLCALVYHLDSPLGKVLVQLAVYHHSNAPYNRLRLLESEPGKVVDRPDQLVPLAVFNPVNGQGAQGFLQAVRELGIYILKEVDPGLTPCGIGFLLSSEKFQGIKQIVPTTGELLEAIFGSSGA